MALRAATSPTMTCRGADAGSARAALVLGLAVLSLLAARTAQSKTAEAAETGVRCEILTREESGRIRLGIRIRSKRPLAGSYTLTAIKGDSGSKSRASQSGPFAVGAGASVLPAALLISGPGEATITLELRASNGVSICTQHL